MTDVPRREIVIGRIRVRFFVKRRIAQTLVQSPANAFAPLRISTPAATAFDLIRYASRLGGHDRAVETFLPLLPLIRISDLERVLAAEKEATTAQRLAQILETAGKPALAKAIRPF